MISISCPDDRERHFTALAKIGTRESAATHSRAAACGLSNQLLRSANTLIHVLNLFDQDVRGCQVDAHVRTGVFDRPCRAESNMRYVSENHRRYLGAMNEGQGERHGREWTTKSSRLSAEATQAYTPSPLLHLSSTPHTTLSLVSQDDAEQYTGRAPLDGLG